MGKYYKIASSAVLSVLIFFAGMVPAKAAEVSEKVIVVFNNKADSSLVDQYGVVDQELDKAKAVSATVPIGAIDLLENNPNVKSVEKDTLVKINSESQEWGVQATNAPQSWSSGYTGKGVKIAVIDTGIAQHEDLTISGGVSIVNGSSSYFDNNGHGTHIAGIIGAKKNALGVVGIAPESSLYAVKVLDSKGEGYLSDVIAGIEWSIEHKMDIINLSMGSNEPSDALRNVIDNAYANGVLIVAAAGNAGTSDGTGDNVEYPARYPSVIAVSAIDANKNRADFSSTGPEVEVSAPGVSVKSTYLNNGYAYLSGTSMAAPFVSGDLALLKQAHPSMTTGELRNLLDVNTLDLGAQGKDLWFGYGLVQAPIVTQTPSPPTTSSIYRVITGGFLGEANVKQKLETLRTQTGWWATYEPLEQTAPYYRIFTGEFIGEDAVAKAMNDVQLESEMWMTYERTRPAYPTYRIVTGGFKGKENVELALAGLQRDTGWWATYEPTGQLDTYRIVTGGLGGEAQAKEALARVSARGWWATFEEYGEPVYYYRIRTGEFLDENAAKQSLTFFTKRGWWATYTPSGRVERYYCIVTGGFAGLDVAEQKAQWLSDTYGWWVSTQYVQ
ncbi:S8 family serine peptidase [Neobacillus citreus]|uniref:S8 family serine peptidase n=1 Tax=Neobacillus citreus TaxID=2833578 RepID=A0A942YB85_9BACI|nr:S8 family serine peptidase [Neobacillus citreus]MCH6266535.1 S8 family serine peptidase [Neobacillus citreus]